MKLPRIRTMEHLFLGIGIVTAISAVGIWLYHFHLPELLTVYGTSITSGVIYGIYLKTRKRR